MASTVQNFKGLILSATELRQMTNWPDALIEDYLSMLESLTLLAETVDIKTDKLRTVTRVTTTPYEVTDTDEDVFFDTDINAIVANLRPGTAGRNYRLLNVGTLGNAVTINPYGTELLFGVNASEFLIDQEVLDITYEDTEGWN